VEAPLPTVAGPTLSIPTTLVPTITAPVGGDVPVLVMVVNGEDNLPIGVQGTLTNADGTSQEINNALEAGNPRITVPVNSLIIFAFRAAVPSQATLRRFSGNGITLQAEENLIPAQEISYVLPSLPGTYVIEVKVVSPVGSLNYLFRVSVQP
jgi:hypothetical protein